MQQPMRPLMSEIDQLKRSVDSMNSQTAEILRNLESMRHIGADHLALPSTEQEKLDREWEYFETENAKYKLKRQQNVLNQQLNPLPSPQPEVMPVSLDQTPSGMSTDMHHSTAPSTTQGTVQGAVSPSASKSTLQQSTDSMDMLSPPSNINPISTPERMSTASLLSAAAAANANVNANANTNTNSGTNTNINAATIQNTAPAEQDMSMMDDQLASEEDRLQDTMLDLGDIGNLGGEMDDLINF
ncbi:hypothetical protein BGZ76_004520 [Entomortierella beljakovae]|nr:hypothetical protein BGZ76_004520 [Entomortierella beljakovae]